MWVWDSFSKYFGGTHFPNTLVILALIVIAIVIFIHFFHSVLTAHLPFTVQGDFQIPEAISLRVSALFIAGVCIFPFCFNITPRVKLLSHSPNSVSAPKRQTFCDAGTLQCAFFILFPIIYMY